jgi:hypothetical protein
VDPQERSNALRCTGADGLHGFGMGLVSLLTVMPLLLSRLGAGKVELGLLFSLGAGGWIVGQPLGLFLLGRRPRTARFFVRWVLSLWMPAHVAMAAVVWVLAPADATACRLALLGLVCVVTVGDGMVVPVWTDWQASLFRRASRGRAMGLIAGAWALGSGMGSLAAGPLRAALGFPLGYAALFLGAACLFAASAGFVSRVREAEGFGQGRPTLGVRDLLLRLRQSLAVPNYRRYVASRMLMALGGGAMAFYAVHFRGPTGGDLSESAVIVLGALTALSQFVGSNLLGRLGDRVGHKRAVAIGCLAQAAAIAVAVVGRGPFACGACFAILGISFSAGWVSHNNILFETCPHDSRVAHITLSNALLAPFVLLVPVGTGWLVGQVGLRAGMGLTLIPTLAGIAWLVLMVREPREDAGARRQG